MYIHEKSLLTSIEIKTLLKWGIISLQKYIIKIKLISM